MDSNKDGNPVEKDDVQNGSDVNKPVAPLPETSQNLGSGNSEGTLERSNASKDGDNPQSEDSEGVADLNLGKDSSGVDDNFKPYVDHFQTKQQQERDKVITKILTEYASSYAKKGRVKEQCQKFMIFICGVFVVISVFGILGLTCRVVIAPESISDLSALAAFVTAFVGFASLVFGLITVITKYAFPEDDERYIADIVKAIQDNDLSHKIANMKLVQGASLDSDAENENHLS